MSIPHLSLPFRLQDGSFATSEQGTADEIADCVQVLVSTVTGQRIEVPTYGIPSPVFAQEAPQVSPILLATVQKWEPRANIAISDSVDSTDDLVRHIRFAVRSTSVNV